MFKLNNEISKRWLILKKTNTKYYELYTKLFLYKYVMNKIVLHT